jgi:predicted MFS family arabinose efflux permease
VGAGDLRTVCGSGYFAMFALTAASMGFSIYAPAILQELRGFSPLEAGYLVGVESMAWTVSALVVAGAVGAWDRRWTRLGAVLLVVSLVVLAMMTGGGHLAWVILGAALLGAGFGFSWAFMSRRILSVLTDEDRAIGSSAITAVRQTGAAAGAAISGVAANLSGFSSGLSAASAQAASVWVFVAVIPLALAGLWATWRMTDEA